MEEKKYADIFGKCEKYTLANEFRAKGIYPYFHALESRQAPEVLIDEAADVIAGVLREA